MIVGERPSFSQSYAKAVTKLYKRMMLVSQIPELQGDCGRDRIPRFRSD